MKLQIEQKEIEIIHFEENYATDFFELNRQWLEKYFHLEAVDYQVLENPQTEIIDKGGYILLAKYKDEIIGTAALIAANNQQLELSKMSVNEKYQGLGVGKTLAQAAVQQYKESDFKQLYLESNRQLKPALNLYEKLGFMEKPYPFENSHYSRSDIYMEFQETNNN